MRYCVVLMMAEIQLESMSVNAEFIEHKSCHVNVIKCNDSKCVTFVITFNNNSRSHLAQYTHDNEWLCECISHNTINIICRLIIDIDPFIYFNSAEHLFSFMSWQQQFNFMLPKFFLFSSLHEQLLVLHIVIGGSAQECVR
jgi:hypothetical protein